jgi:uncharacterized protein (TIGR03435 family)
MRGVFVALSVVLFASGSSAQQTSGSAYDSVSITVSHSTSSRSTLTFNDQALVATNVTLSSLIDSAYGIEGGLIYGLDDAVNAQRYNIVAQRTSDQAVLSGAEQTVTQRMLQNMLATQFGLVAHVVERDLPVYELRRADAVPKLEPASVDPGTRQPDDRRYWGTNITMASLANFLTLQSHRIVVDATGLTERYNVRFAMPPHAQGESGPRGYNAPDPHPWSESNWSALNAALLQDAGLCIEPAVRPIKTLQIDHVELATR